MDVHESSRSNSSDDESDFDNESAFEEDDTGSDYVPSDNDEKVSSTSEGEDSVSQTSTSKSLNKKKKASFSILNKPETIDDLFPGPESNQQVDVQETIDDIFPDNSDANEPCATKMKELYPPEGKRVKIPSIVWKFGGFRRKENSSLDTEFVFC